MRQAQKSNRTRGRSNRKSGGNLANRVYESAGPEGKVRGTPQQIIDKYLTLARDAQTSGDRVSAENFLQHAEHYQRILIQATGPSQDQRRDAPAGEEEGADEREAEPAEGRQNGARARSGDKASERDDDHADPPQPSVSGMTTIDSGEDRDDNLLVGADEVSASQPRRKGNGHDGSGQDDEEGDQGSKEVQTDNA